MNNQIKVNPGKSRFIYNNNDTVNLIFDNQAKYNIKCKKSLV